MIKIFRFDLYFNIAYYIVHIKISYQNLDAAKTVTKVAKQLE